jgi:hypothetical protein
MSKLVRLLRRLENQQPDIDRDTNKKSAEKEESMSKQLTSGLQQGSHGTITNKFDLPGLSISLYHQQCLTPRDSIPELLQALTEMHKY